MNEETGPQSSGKEPQSYGSSKDWVSGKTSQTVDDSPAKISRVDEPFYESRHGAITKGSDDIAPAQYSFESDSVAADTSAVEITGTGLTKTHEGTRHSFFKNRDYK